MTRNSKATERDNSAAEAQDQVLRREGGDWLAGNAPHRRDAGETLTLGGSKIFTEHPLPEATGRGYPHDQEVTR